MSTATRKMAQDLVSKMTIEEKMGQMLYQSPAIERLGIPAYNWWNEALHGVARAGVATMFPQAIGMAATFDKDLLNQIADVASTEGRAKFNEFSKRGDVGIYKGLTFWTPNVNIFRDPRWGRGQETFGEDPYLSAELGVAYVKGLQGDDSEHLKATACAKHFAVHSGPEEFRHEFDAKVSVRDLYDTYLYAFKRCVEAGVEAVMGAYNRVNGEPACGSKTLLKDILREEWGFEGHVVSDCWAIKDFNENHHVTDTIEESVALAVNNGCDLNCGNAYLYLNSAYEQGLVNEEAITTAVERLIEVRIRLGMLSNYPSPYTDISYTKVECDEHVELSLEAARRSFVLLKNEILPLNSNQYKTIAVIGPNANSREGLLGNYIGTSSRYITPLEGIQQHVGDKAKVLYAEGCHLYKDSVEPLAETQDRFSEAVIVAEEADVVVMCLGFDATIEGEQGDTGNAYASGDKMDLSFPGQQQALLERISEVGKPVILLVCGGSAVDLSWAKDNVEAILFAWYPGARGGKAIAEVIFGDYSPSGKLPLTFYKNAAELPDFCDYSMAGRTYRYAQGNIVYPFGYGLNYSDIVYSGAGLSETKCQVTDDVKVHVKVENTGKFTVNESVQVYIKYTAAEPNEPGYQLKGIAALKLEPGDSRNVEIELQPRDFAVITEEGKCVVRPGRYLISIGGNQPDDVSEQLTGRKTSVLEVEKTGDRTEVEY